ncbi:hypothetical protein [Kribbella sp.]|uniref:hypothetical protein n=1 Tax=Kribbella sp. TaxID=1871183 RepID=UPI002D2A3A7E|nr:hypothetical protein [Kribbella sp.]HZX05631.1 hypothetical protein [Kribbella sp.]
MRRGERTGDDRTVARVVELGAGDVGPVRAGQPAAESRALVKVNWPASVSQQIRQLLRLPKYNENDYS